MQQVQAQIRKVRDTKGVSSSPIPVRNKCKPNGKETRGGSSDIVTEIQRESSNSTKTNHSLSPRLLSNPVLRKELMISPIAPYNMTRVTDSRPSSPQPFIAALNRKSLSPKPMVKENYDLIPQLPRSTHHATNSSSNSSSVDSFSDSGLPILKSAFRRPLSITQKLLKSEQAQEEEDKLAFMPLNTARKQASPIYVEDPSNKEYLRPVITTPTDIGSQFKGKGKAGIDGIRSMRSSFSDLDETSITQSALEEALASNMQAGGMVSRISSISHALRSKYLP